MRIFTTPAWQRTGTDDMDGYVLWASEVQAMHSMHAVMFRL
jgi:hypothetical protein